VATTAARDAAFLAVFIEGKLVGGPDRLMAKHIVGELVPEAGRTARACFARAGLTAAGPRIY
jgi:hypothetical protein